MATYTHTLCVGFADCPCLKCRATRRAATERHATGHNHGDAPPMEIKKVGDVSYRREGDGWAVVDGCEVEEAVVPVAADPVAVALDQEVASLFPVGRRPLNQAEVAVVVALNAGGMSKNKIIEAVYGHKDGKTMSWINQALLGEWVEKEPDIFADFPDGEQVILDMSSAEGVDLWKELNSKGLVNLPSPEKFYTQENRS